VLRLRCDGNSALVRVIVERNATNDRLEGVGDGAALFISRRAVCRFVITTARRWHRVEDGVIRLDTREGD
jgi:hypothetical protein